MLHCSSKCGLESAVKPGKDGGDGDGDNLAGCVREGVMLRKENQPPLYNRVGVPVQYIG